MSSEHTESDDFEERKFLNGNAPAAGYHEHSNEVVSVQTRGETYWFDQQSLKVFRDRLDRLVVEDDDGE